MLRHFLEGLSYWHLLSQGLSEPPKLKKNAVRSVVSVSRIGEEQSLKVAPHSRLRTPHPVRLLETWTSSKITLVSFLKTGHFYVVKTFLETFSHECTDASC